MSIPRVTPIPTPPRSRFEPPLSTIARSYPAQADAPLEVEIRPGNGMVWGADEQPISKEEARFIFGLMAVFTVIFGLLVLAVWLWSRGIVVWR